MPAYHVRGHCFYIMMKRRQILFFGMMALTFALLAVSCKSDEQMIEKNALAYLDAMGNYRISEAENFATTETINHTLHFIENTIMPNLDSSFIKLNTPATIEINQITIIDDSTAEVAYTKTTPIQKQEGKLDMVKENQEWKAKVIIAIPQFMNVNATIDSTKGKELDAKFKGKLRTAPPDTTRRSRILN